MTTGLDEYQTQAMRCHVPDPIRLPAYGLGLTGEAGEVADLIKKHIGHGHELDVGKLKLELGDVLWYVTGLAQVLGLTLSEIAQANINKLERRYPAGWDPERSKNRATDDV